MGIWKWIQAMKFYGHAEWSVKFKEYDQIFDSYLSYGALKCSHKFVYGSHALAMFSAHALRDGRGHAHINVTTFTRFAHNCNVGQSLFALYGSTMQVATLQPYLGD